MSGYDEAVAWFRADPGRVRDLDDVDNRSAAIAIVNAVLADDALAADRSPRSWSLPAPPPDDVTVVQAADQLAVKADEVSQAICGSEEMASEILDDAVHAYRMVRDPEYAGARIGTVVEGEPPAAAPPASRHTNNPCELHPVAVRGTPSTARLEPAPEPRFERGVYRLARDLDVDGTPVPAESRVVVVHTYGERGVYVASPHGAHGLIPVTALAAAGAVRVEEEQA